MAGPSGVHRKMGGAIGHINKWAQFIRRQAQRSKGQNTARQSGHGTSARCLSPHCKATLAPSPTRNLPAATLPSPRPCPVPCPHPPARGWWTPSGRMLSVRAMGMQPHGLFSDPSVPRQLRFPQCIWPGLFVAPSIVSLYQLGALLQKCVLNEGFKAGPQSTQAVPVRTPSFLTKVFWMSGVNALPYPPPGNWHPSES